ncbi:MAG: sigma-54 dependent transcriptional regulator, partial [Bacteroidota bacterium]
VRKTRQRQPATPPVPAAEPFAIIGESPAMQAVFGTLDKVAATDANVLILGEHGTGKELVARRLHARSHRADGPFVSVDLGAVTASLFESELFGHTKGAFTGADHDRQGQFEAASGGTLFLDEIGNIPLELQNKLLTVLERRAVTRVGSLDPRPVDVRLVCATNRPIYDLAEGDPGSAAFRPDLLFRINTVEVELPPLRARGEDIIRLAQHFLTQFAGQYGSLARTLSLDAQQKLRGYGWPGNVRELRNTMERAVILSDGTTLQPADLRLSMQGSASPVHEPTDLDLEGLERTAIRQALSTYGGNISKAAAALGLTRRSLYRRIEKYGL